MAACTIYQILALHDVRAIGPNGLRASPQLLLHIQKSCKGQQPPSESPPSTRFGQPLHYLCGLVGPRLVWQLPDLPDLFLRPCHATLFVGLGCDLLVYIFYQCTFSKLPHLSPSNHLYLKLYIIITIDTVSPWEGDVHYLYIGGHYLRCHATSPTPHR